MKRHLSTLLFCGLVMFGSAFARDIPKPNGYVNDFAGVLDQSTEDVLVAKTRQLKADKNIELGIAIITTTGGREIAEYGTQMAREWGVGAKDGEQRGLLLIVATHDRKSNIQVSRHLEGDFTDARTGEILRTGRDDFKAGRFGEGIIKITDALIERANAVGIEDKNATQPKDDKGWDISVLYVFLGIVGFGAVGVVYPVVRELLSLRRKPQSGTTPSDATLAAGRVARAAQQRSSSTSSSPISHHSSSSNSHGSSSSHSSSSFGGGSDFGGGGASDSW